MAKEPVGKKSVGPNRTVKQAAHEANFEKTFGKSAFSPALTTKMSQIQNWVDQGKGMDDLHRLLGGSISREEIQKFLNAKGMQIKKIRSTNAKTI